MGGFGSGNWSSCGGKTKAEDVRRIDIRNLKRNGLLIPGISGPLFWSCGGELCGSIIVRAEDDRLVLSYSSRASDDEWKSINENIYFDYTSCNYGGERKWFLCPHCSKRVGVLYGAGIRFLCRHCYNLTYSSQNEDFTTRMYRKSRKIRNKLGVSGGVAEPIWQKPKGMHWKTFSRLVAEEEQANNAASYRIAQKFSLLPFL